MAMISWFLLVFSTTPMAKPSKVFSLTVWLRALTGPPMKVFGRGEGSSGLSQWVFSCLYKLHYETCACSFATHPPPGPYKLCYEKDSVPAGPLLRGCACEKRKDDGAKKRNHSAREAGSSEELPSSNGQAVLWRWRRALP